MQLKDYDFSDLYLRDGGRALLKGVPNEADPVPAPSALADELIKLREKCEQQGQDKDEFSVRHEGVAYRAATLVSLEQRVFVLRRFPEKVPPLDSLGLSRHYVEQFTQPGLTGLVMIAGAFGMGKTTTASAIVARRLEAHGGVAVTIEDPPEMPLEGEHGDGVCFQTAVEQGGFGQRCRQTARYAPSIIYLGEIRDGETAAEALRASINGRLVVCTIHADNVTMAIERLYALGVSNISNGDDVASMLSGGLACVLHQKLVGEEHKQLRTEHLWLRGEDAKGAQNQIRHRNFNQLGSEISLQRNRLLHQRSAA